MAPIITSSTVFSNLKVVSSLDCNTAWVQLKALKGFETKDGPFTYCFGAI
jgi:hypothetical protein